jgi:copper transport protein
MGAVARRVSLVLAVAAVALFLPAAAFAHARLVTTKPGNSAALSTGPGRVTVTFDSPIHVGPGNKVVRNGGGSVLAGTPETQGNTLVLLLQAPLAKGDYSVLWSVVSDDGHPEEGVLSFSVGTGRAPGAPSLRAAGSVGFSTVLSRWIFFAGLLLAGGFALFDVMIWRPVAGSHLGTGVIAIGLAAMFLSAHGLVHASHAGTSTRFGLVIQAASVLGATGAAAAAIGIADRSAAPFALALALAVLPAPTLAGHALDAGRPWYELPVDVLHVAAAALWLGGLVALAFVVPRSAHPPETKAAATRVFSRYALWSVIVLAVTGAVRALSELGAVSQLWTTGYGRAIVVKSILLAMLVLLGWMSRRRIAAAYTRLRTTVVAEIAVFLGVIVAVAFLTALPPGRRAQAAVQPATPTAQPSRPPPDATVLAQKDGQIAATIAVRPSGEAIAGFIGTNGLPASVGALRIDGARTRSCGVGCYRGTAHGRFVAVTHGTSKLRFDLGLRTPVAGLVARATRTYRALKTVRYSETLSAGYGPVVRTVWTEVAPDRLSYTIARGAKGIVIGDRRWDLSASETTWQESPSVVLPMPSPTWGSVVTNAHLLRAGPKTQVVSFLEPRSPAWFTVTFDRKTLHPLVLEMIAPAHFMHQRYTAFNAPLTIEPPPG